MKRVAVDLTPILPGGENGGAKIMIIELLQKLKQIATNFEFLLLTTARNHAELAILDAPNIRRLCVDQKKEDLVIKSGNILRKSLVNRLLEKLPMRIKIKLKAIPLKLRRKKMQSMLKDLDIKLLFCPFTAPLDLGRKIPLVCVVYDLQSYYYPNFFHQEECFYRSYFFSKACILADRLICISDYVKDTIHQKSPIVLDKEKVKTIYIALSQRLPESPKNALEILDRYNLTADNYLLYPANFWLHKNHKMLFTAYSMYRHKNILKPLKLVCTGFECEKMQELKNAASKMGFEELIIFPGYISNQEFKVLLNHCRAVIFPSLYEGFGMPVLEAMAMGKPVLCSNVTSLPEIAGNAALLFDPRKPDQIAEAIQKIDIDNELVNHLINKGKERVQQFGDGLKMAEQYLEIFRDVMKKETMVVESCQ